MRSIHQKASLAKYFDVARCGGQATNQREEKNKNVTGQGVNLVCPSLVRRDLLSKD